MILRPHHGLCLAFFKGKGYNDTFTAHMAAIQRLLVRDDPAVCLEPETDVICACCPHNHHGVCGAADKVTRYDRAVLAQCSLDAGAELPWSAFSHLVHKRILTTNRRREICGDCQWNHLCQSTVSSIPNPVISYINSHPSSVG